MYHPLLPSLTEIKQAELEEKISDLTRKYWIAARSGNSYLCEQMLIVIEAHKTELQNRNQAALKAASDKSGNSGLDDLIKIN